MSFRRYRNKSIPRAASNATPPIDPTMAGTNGTTLDGLDDGVDVVDEVGKMVLGPPGPGVNVTDV